MVRPATGRKWDFPYMSSPSNLWVIDALRLSDHQSLRREAFNLASKWVQTIYSIWRDTGHMLDKVYSRFGIGFRKQNLMLVSE